MHQIKGKALRRALATSQAYRLDGSVPLITDVTEMITPAMAEEYLKRNAHNRPINFKRVEQYAATMAAGLWVLTAQGIIFDSDGNLMNGQNRLYAIALSGMTVPMRVSRGTPASAAKLIDRGAPQTARDLAARDTGAKQHSPTEASIARGVLAARGILRPSKDELGKQIAEQWSLVTAMEETCKGTKKTRAIIMALAAIAEYVEHKEQAVALTKEIDRFADEITLALLPSLSPEKCWGRGAAFLLAMEKARHVVRGTNG